MKKENLDQRRSISISHSLSNFVIIWKLTVLSAIHDSISGYKNHTGPDVWTGRNQNICPDWFIKAIELEFGFAPKQLFQSQFELNYLKHFYRSISRQVERVNLETK